MKKTNRLMNYLLPVITILAILLIWFFAALGVNESLILPSPLTVFGEIFSLFGSGDFWTSFGGTLLRSVIAFICSFVIAGSLALFCKFSKVTKSAIKVIVSILRALPTIAVVLLLLLWTNSKVAAVVVTMIVVLPTLFGAIRTCLNLVDAEVLEMCRIFRLSKKQQFKSYIVPQVLPETIEVIGNGLSLNIKLMVAAEVLAGTANSLGNLMSESKIYFETAQLFALVVITVGICLLIEFALDYVSRIVRRKYGFKQHM